MRLARLGAAHPTRLSFLRVLMRRGERSVALLRVLEDAHENLGGAALTDLRFFDEGRIIVKPKGK